MVTKEPIKTPVIATNYDPCNPNIKNIIHNNWYAISNSPDCRKLFSDKPIISFRRLPNLRDKLTNASIIYPPPGNPQTKHKPVMCIRLLKCTDFPLIKKLETVKCNFTHKSHKLKDLPKHITHVKDQMSYI